MIRRLARNGLLNTGVGPAKHKAIQRKKKRQIIATATRPSSQTSSRYAGKPSTKLIARTSSLIRPRSNQSEANPPQRVSTSITAPAIRTSLRVRIGIMA